MLKIIVIVLAALVVVILGLAMTKADSFSVERKTSIQAPPGKIFPLINDFHNWNSWSPWEELDPGMSRTHSGAASGNGAIYEWDGNSKVGKGRMEITEVAPPSRIAIKLDFLKPFEGHNIAEFTLEPLGSSTNVTWTMHGPTPFVSKVMQVFISMDKLIGKDFDSGLTNLKTIAEK